MTAAGNPLYAMLFGDPDTQALFTAEAELDAMIRVEVALARVQAQLGVIPPNAGPAIAAASRGLLIDPASLAQATARNGVPVPALVQEMRRQMAGDPAAAHLHWGATSQDIMDSALALRLRPMLDLWGARLDAVLTQLAALADRHANLPENDIFYDTPQYESDTVYPLTLNSGEYFILGDQRGNAKDSRYFGAVKDKEIKGRVITVLRRSDI